MSPENEAFSPGTWGAAPDVKSYLSICPSCFLFNHFKKKLIRNLENYDKYNANNFISF